MSGVIKVITNSCSSTALSHCGKSMHALAKGTSQINLERKRSEAVIRNFGHVNIAPRFYPKKPAHFSMHPEILKQLIKQKDVQIMCDFLSKEGQRKRNKCLLYVEKKKRMVTTLHRGRNVARSYSTAKRKSKQQSSYASYINSQHDEAEKERENFGIPNTNDSETDQFKSKEVLSLDNKKNPSNQKTTRRRKKLKPLQAFKRTRSLSRTCEMNMPEQLYPVLLGKSDDIELEPRREMSKKTFFKDVDEDITGSFTPVHEKNKKEKRESLVKEKIFTRNKYVKKRELINDVFTLFDKVKLDSDKKRQNDGTEAEEVSTIKSEALRIANNVNNMMQKREMHLKNEFKKLIRKNNGSLSVGTQTVSKTNEKGEKKVDRLVSCNERSNVSF